MSKLMFLPISIGAGLLAGLIGKKLFGVVWGVIDEEPPSAEHRDVTVLKLIAALVLQGTLFSLIKGLVDHGSRHAFAPVTGARPGDEQPEAKSP